MKKVLRLPSAAVSLFTVVVPLVVGKPAAAELPNGGQGAVHFPVLCGPGIQARFDHGVAALHNFSFPDAIPIFTAIIKDDPSCGLAYWGLSISQRRNPLTPPFSAAAMQTGWEVAQQGLAANPPNPRERAWLEAISLFYKDHATVDQATRGRAYAEAMRRLHESAPDDPEAALFYALALNEVADLSDRTYANQMKAVAILQDVARTQPDHPGVLHYLIHSYDFAPLAAMCLPVARHYGEIAPAAQHALHMPSHIYSMLGLWADSITSNEVAETRAREEAARVFSGNDHPAIPHLRDFRAYAYLQTGQDKLAKSLADDVKGMNLAVHQLPVDTAQQAILARYALDRGRWDEAARVEVLASGYPAATAIGYFTRGLGAALSGDLAQANAELASLGEVKTKLAESRQEYWVGQTDIQMRVLGAWIDFAGGNHDVAIAAMQRAADLDDASEKSVSMENKLLPARALLGEMYLAAGLHGEALAAFEASAKDVPNRFRTLLGAAQASKGLNRVETAKQYYRALIALAVRGDGERPELMEAKTWLASQ